MPKGMSLHIGLNHVDPNHYQGWDGRGRLQFDGIAHVISDSPRDRWLFASGGSGTRLTQSGESASGNVRKEIIARTQ